MSGKEDEACVIDEVLPQYVSYSLLGLNGLILLTVSIYSMIKIQSNESFKKANCFNKTIKYK